MFGKVGNCQIEVGFNGEMVLADAMAAGVVRFLFCWSFSHMGKMLYI